MSKAHRTHTVSLPIDLADKLDELAKQNDSTTDGLIKEAVADMLAWEEEKHRRTLEGLASVDAGHTVSDEEMETWIKSLGTDHELPVPK